MNAKRERKIMLRISLISTIPIALLWVLYRKFVGEVPEMTQMAFMPGLIWKLPFGISRWYDVLLGPFYVIFFIKLSTIKNRDKDSMLHHLVCGLTPGLIFGLILGMFCGLFYGVYMAMLFGILFPTMLTLAVRLEKFVDPIIISPTNWIMTKIWNWIIAKETTQAGVETPTK